MTFSSSKSESAPFPEISVRNLQRSISINVVDIERFVEKALRLCLKRHKRKSTKLTKLRAVFVWLISDRLMVRLHRQFLNQAGPTDVLTFQHGEIFVSIETAHRNARVFRNSFTGELQLCIVHGLLHLHGLNDRTQGGRRKMKKAQQGILRELAGR